MHKTATIFFFPQRQKPLILFLYCDFCVGNEVCYKYKGRFLHGVLSRPGIFPVEELSSPQTELPSLHLCMCGEAHTRHQMASLIHEI